MRPFFQLSRRPAIAGSRPTRDNLRVAPSRLLPSAAFSETLIRASSGATAWAAACKCSIQAALLFLCLASGMDAWGQTPRAIVTGPRESRPGALVVLDATESVGTGRLWLLAVSPEETSFLPVESGLKCIFASPTPGVYRFVLVVAGTNSNGGPAADMTTHEVRLVGGGTVTPPITPPVITDPTTPATATTGPAYLVVIRRSEDLTADQAATLLKLRAWADQQPQLASLLEISPESGDDDPRLAGYIAKAGPLPWLVLSRAKKDGSGAAVLWSVALPQSDAAVRQKVEEVTK